VNRERAATLAAALGYFVDIYDLILFGTVRKPSLVELGFTTVDELTNKGLFLFNMQMGGLIIGGILCGTLGDKRGRLSVLFGSIFTYSLANLGPTRAALPRADRRRRAGLVRDRNSRHVLRSRRRRARSPSRATSGDRTDVRVRGLRGRRRDLGAGQSMARFAAARDRDLPRPDDRRRDPVLRDRRDLERRVLRHVHVPRRVVGLLGRVRHDRGGAVRHEPARDRRDYHAELRARLGRLRGSSPRRGFTGAG